MFISIGKCSRTYLYILGSPLFKFFSLLLLGDDSISFIKGSEDGIGLFGFCPSLKNFNFMQSLLTYFGYIVFGIVFLNFKKIKQSSNNDLEKKEKKEKNEKNDIYIYNRPVENKLKYMWKQILLVGVFFPLHIESKNILYIKGFQFFNFWTLEVIFIQHFMRKYFIIDYYIHHKFAIIFNASICSAILLTCSFLPTSLSNDNPGNSYQNINARLGSYFYCILFILVFLILSYIYSFTRVYSKVFMQYRFISPFKIIIIYGFFGFIICLIAFGVSSPIKYEDNIINYIDKMKKILLENKKRYKFYVEIFCVYPFFSFISFMEIYFEILAICYLNPFYILMTNTIYYGITEAIYFLKISEKDNIKIVHFILTELAEIFSLLGLMIYLEILILNFCRLNENVKIRIIEKGEEEFRKLSFPGAGNIFIDDDDEDDEPNEVDNNTNNNNEDKTNNKDNKDEIETKTEIKKQYRNI